MSALQPTDYALGMPLVALGMILIVGGIVGLAWIFRYELGYDEPEIPPVVDPDRTAIISAVRPEPNYHRSDDDTHVFARIPGATPTPAADISDEQLAAVVDGLRHLPSGPELVRFLDALDADVRVLDAAGPVCPTCGGPFGACACYGQKSAPMDSGETQVVDLCPLTTQDLPKIPDVEPPLFAETFTRHPRAELGTQELSGSVARAKGSAA